MQSLESRLEVYSKFVALLAAVALCSFGCPLLKPTTRSVVFLNASPWKIEKITQDRIDYSTDGRPIFTIEPLIENYLTSPLPPQGYVTIDNLEVTRFYSFAVTMTEEQVGFGEADYYSSGVVLWVEKGDHYIVVLPRDGQPDSFPFNLEFFGEDWPGVGEKRRESPGRMLTIPMDAKTNASPTEILRQQRLN